MDRKKNNKGIYNTFLYGAIGYVIVAIICMVAGNWNTAIAYLCTTVICGAAYYSVKRFSKENEEMADEVDKNRWRNPNVELPEYGQVVIIKVKYTVDGEIGYKVGQIIAGKLRIANQNEDCEIIGWRPIE